MEGEKRPATSSGMIAFISLQRHLAIHKDSAYTLQWLNCWLRARAIAFARAFAFSEPPPPPPAKRRRSKGNDGHSSRPLLEPFAFSERELSSALESCLSGSRPGRRRSLRSSWSRTEKAREQPQSPFAMAVCMSTSKA